jgi:hypothetical protein
MHLRAAELMAFDEMTSHGLFADDFQSYIAQAAELCMAWTICTVSFICESGSRDLNPCQDFHIILVSQGR